jgi:hypothetical protein
MKYIDEADERWQYSEPKMKLFEEALKILIYYYGNGEDYPSKPIFECANEWVNKGHMTCSGLAKYYDAYYTGKCDK